MLPPALDEWFERALRRDPVNRFQNVTEMANAYLAVLDRASLLPHWAEARHARGAEPIYDTDPGGLSGPLFPRDTRSETSDRRGAPWQCASRFWSQVSWEGVRAPSRRGENGAMRGCLSRLWAEWVMPNVKLHVDPAVRETPKDDGPHPLPPAARNGALSETPRPQDPTRPQDLGRPQGSAEPKIPQPPVSPVRRPADVDVAPRLPSLPATRPAEPFQTEPREESPYDKTPYEVTPPTNRRHLFRRVNAYRRLHLPRPPRFSSASSITVQVGAAIESQTTPPFLRRALSAKTDPRAARRAPSPRQGPARLRGVGPAGRGPERTAEYRSHHVGREAHSVTSRTASTTSPS